MRELFFKIFAPHPETDFNKMSMFSWTHILFLVIIFGTIVVLVLLFKNKKAECKTELLKWIAILLAIVYIGDFFIHPISNGGTIEANGEIWLDKLPFHICTVLCPLVLFATFAKKGGVIKTPVVVLSVVAPLMWLV